MICFGFKLIRVIRDRNWHNIRLLQSSKVPHPYQNNLSDEQRARVPLENINRDFVNRLQIYKNFFPNLQSLCILWNNIFETF